MDTTKKKRPAAPAQPTRRAKPNTARPASKRAAPPRAKTAARKPRTAASQPRKVQPRKVQPRPTPDVVYTPPKPFSRSRLLFQLGSVVAVVLAITFGLSIFFKVETVMVSGAQKYSAWTVKEASGIQEGDSLLSFGEIKAIGNIMAELPYVKDVRIGIKLPDTVNIVIEELDVAYAVQDGADRWWLITADGKVVDQVDDATAQGYTKLLGVRIGNPVANQQASAWEPQTDPTDPTASTVIVTVPAQEKLNAALSILQYLEDNSIMGLVASVDVEDLADIELWYGQQYQVRLGDNSQLSYKVRCMVEAVAQLKDYDTGLLDCSFQLKEDQVIYDPFMEGES